MNNSTSGSLIGNFFKLESASGILLAFSTLLAIGIANTSWVSYYQLLLSTLVEIRVGDFDISKPLLLWINDGLMAVFFFLIGLELKRELLEGELSDPKNIILPTVGAIGGMAAPALIYISLNWGDAEAIKGWAIPAATDIAFALGVLSLLGSRVPISLKVFLTSLAIFDDIGAILIIAFFYTQTISMLAITIVLGCLFALFILNRRHVTSFSAYLMVGIIMWVATLKSGVHATLAGVVLAAFIPMHSKDGESSPVKNLEHDLHGLVAFFILPIFAFSNAGVDLRDMTFDHVFHGVPIGITLGLFLGKQFGIFGLCWLAIKLKIASLPRDMSWTSLYGTSALCGIGFTMSLFIGSLAFEGASEALVFDERVGILLGSILSGIMGYLILQKCYAHVPCETSNIQDKKQAKVKDPS